MHYGIPVSPGVVVAPAFCLDDVLGRPIPQNGSTEDAALEISRFHQACEEVATELRDLIQRVSEDIGEKEAAIFQSHLLMLRDPAFVAKVRTIILESKRDAASAVREALVEYEVLFGKIEDEYLRERLVDLRDVVSRLETFLSSHPRLETMDFSEPVVVVAQELFPSQTVRFGQLRIAAIVTERGGATSHAAIIARSMGIPLVSGIPDVFSLIQTGDVLAVDGREGRVIVNPGPEAQAAYRKLQREFFDLKDYLIENRDQAAVTSDGVSIELLANVNNVSDARAAVEVGARGIGLFRTEYLFLTHPSIPDEEDQFRSYRQVLEASPCQYLTIRTLDLGGDKSVPYLGDQRESNPFMGWRSIRLIFEHPEFFRKQVRAVLRAGASGKVRMLFPMITTVEEVRRVNRLVWQVQRDLEREGIPHGRHVPRGIMIEVPAAAIAIEHFLSHIDFVSIGSNDLVQYLTAADRDNPKVAHLCDPLNPAVLRVLRDVIAACNAHRTPVTVCGEMAGRPRCVLALLAFGLRSFSMSPAFVPIVKELVHSVRLADISAIAEQVLRKRSADQVRRFLNEVLQQVNPRLATLEAR